MRVVHALPDILPARVLAVACGYEDADDLDALRDDPGFRLALGKLTGSGAGQPAQDEPVGERTDHSRAGAHDGGDGRHLLRQLLKTAQGGDAGYR